MRYCLFSGNSEIFEALLWLELDNDSLICRRWSGDTEAVYHEVLDMMKKDFQSKWCHMKDNLVDNTESVKGK